MKLMRIYDEFVPKMSLGELAEELVAQDEIRLHADERIADIYLVDGEKLVVEIHRGRPADIRVYEADIWHLRDIGIGGTAKYIVFGRDEEAEDCLYTFM